MRSLLLVGVLVWPAAVPASSLDRALLKSVMRRADPGFRRCYEEALRDQPALEGKARLTVNVEPDGRVSEVTVEFPRWAPDFSRCLRDETLRLRFPEGPAAFRLVWPTDFKPG